jgi:hypothetical protein
VGREKGHRFVRRFPASPSLPSEKSMSKVKMLVRLERVD